MRKNTTHSWRSPVRCAVAVALVAVLLPVQAFGLEELWTSYTDDLTGTECGVVNAWNAELVVLFESGNMVVVTGPDVIMEDLYVSAQSEVYYFDEPAGFLEFAEDGDGLPTLFWTTLSGTLVEIDTFTGEPSDSGMFPEERFDTGCDGCDFVDQSSVCGDTTTDGNSNSNSSTIDLGELIVPLLCGTGTTSGTVAAFVLLPFLGLFTRRR